MKRQAAEDSHVGMRRTLRYLGTSLFDAAPFPRYTDPLPFFHPRQDHVRRRHQWCGLHEGTRCVIIRILLGTLQEVPHCKAHCHRLVGVAVGEVVPNRATVSALAEVDRDGKGPGPHAYPVNGVIKKAQESGNESRGK